MPGKRVCSGMNQPMKSKALSKYFLPLFIFFISCVSPARKDDPSYRATEKNDPQTPLVPPLSIREQLMDSTLCDGFDFPVGDKNGAGTYTAPNGKKYTGWTVKQNNKVELWNGTGGGHTDLGQPVYAIASGKVVYAGKDPASPGKSIRLEHKYAENGKVITIHSEYSSLGGINVKEGDMVLRRQQIAAIGKDQDSITQLHFAAWKRTGDEPDIVIPTTSSQIKEESGSAFIKNHRKLMPPYKKDKLVLVDKGKFKCYLYNKGNLVSTYEIALGQVPAGAKEKQGDLKVPEGEYRICEKTKGPFTHNWSAAYLGTRWMCLTYPNTFDAQKALGKNMITREQYNKIAAATKAGIKPPQNTALGGGIGLHGWIEEDWSNDSDRAQTWGCVSFHNNDLNEFYELVNIGTTVIIVP